MSKKLQKGSRFLKHDLDGDGVVSDEEIASEERMIRLENNDKMQDQQRIICWVSSVSSIVLILLAMSPAISDKKTAMLIPLLSTYIIANLGIVSVFMLSLIHI